MRNLPFDQPGTFYKGNLHSHSTNSDGALAPADVVKTYRDQGYDFVSITDHYMNRFDWPVTDTTGFRTKDFTTLLGAELHGDGMTNGELWHIVATGLPLDFAPQGPNENGPEIAARAIEAGAFVTIAHPAWNGVTEADVHKIADFDAIEIHNEGHTNDCDRGNGWMLADALATAGMRFSTTAADDAHFKARPDTFGGWVNVKAEALEPEAIQEALKQGRYYSSTGPEINHVELTDDEIVIECSPAQAVFVAGRGSTKVFKRGDDLTQVRLPRASFVNSFCRVTVLDKHGKRAWTSPIWLDELDVE